VRQGSYLSEASDGDHAVDADRAFGMLRDHSRHNGHKHSLEPAAQSSAPPE
jgi:hypothetical protein